MKTFTVSSAGFSDWYNNKYTVDIDIYPSKIFEIWHIKLIDLIRDQTKIYKK